METGSSRNNSGTAVSQPYTGGQQAINQPPTTHPMSDEVYDLNNRKLLYIIIILLAAALVLYLFALWVITWHKYREANSKKFSAFT